MSTSKTKLRVPKDAEPAQKFEALVVEMSRQSARIMFEKMTSTVSASARVEDSIVTMKIKVTTAKGKAKS